MLATQRVAGSPWARARLFCVFLITAVLAACGGGGGSGSNELITRHPVSPNNLSVSVSPTPVSDQSPSTVTLTLTDPDGKPVAGQTIGLQADGNARLSDNQLTTDASGQATTRIFAVAAGDGSVSASFRDSKGPGTASAHYSTRITSSSGSGGAATGSIALTLDLTDSSGQEVGTTNSPITKNRPGLVQATLVDASGTPMPNQVVSFQTSGVGALSPSSGTALTDAQGVAQITLQAGTQQGAGSVIATYSDAAGPVSQSISFSTLGDSGSSSGGSTDTLIGSGTGAGFQEGVLMLSATSVGVGSSLSATVNLVQSSNNQPVTSPQQVTFASSCAAIGKATLDPNPVTSLGGTATVNYEPASGCDKDQITASVTVNGKQKTAVSPSIDVTQSPPNSISFKGADPDVMGVKGSGSASASESSTLSFLVKDQNGQPVGAGQQVDFSLPSTNGGFKITAQTTTDSQGIATVTVQSGSVPFVASVRAQLHSDPSISATGSVSIQSGVVAQDRFSMAVETLNPAAGNHLGAQVKVTVRAADRLGNWPPNGTPIQFTTELGDIQPSCKLQDGTCSVTWSSQGPQTIHYDKDRASRSCYPDGSVERRQQGLPPGLACGANDHFGRSTILATTVGEEAFNDANGNNIYDVGESVDHLPEAYRDDNEDGIREGVADGFDELFKDYINNGNYDGPQTEFRGVGCSQAASDAGNCDQLANVRASSVITLSTDQMRIYAYDVNTDLSGARWQSESDPGQPPQQWGDTIFVGPTQITSVDPAQTGTIRVVVADLNGNAPSVNTQVTFDPGSVTAFGPTTCTAGNQLGALVCEFSYGPPQKTPTTYNSIAITAVSGGDSSVQTTKVIPVIP